MLNRKLEKMALEIADVIEDQVDTLISEDCNYCDLDMDQIVEVSERAKELYAKRVLGL